MDKGLTKASSKAFFLDRDGVINVDHGYVHKIKDFEFFPGVFEACQIIAQAGFKIVIVTNQAGIGRGYYTEQEFNELTSWMVEQFEQQGVSISEVQFCPHHAESGIGHYKQECSHRKPNPGMLLTAAKNLNICLNQSVLVGDKYSDMYAGANAGVEALFYVNKNELEVKESDFFTRCHSLHQAVTLFFD
ncbi:D-glycero-beta-D-manno-heptose 1,7-bisphosphate 7-phosphatase [Paraglaciecola marina]|uniref:D-glycero-beta-D-manno-heptose 1,7-bisphosphate 7-phosphatase n=1 Tax=Paraglaciecola marina TaxID=2500157 RepID=UPI00105E8621|nr:D-glycero-beta-D-manno-heptose 1,7-bisphosphate 7-phosphatase [Paraglaciecola marina]